ncbi:MAG: DNA replication and repair protein RecF [Candidatus Krumholzibacteriota bacterium]|nr:DNA replication and repair protein RecF [Candidatus Krumholzibacteriota bacterium]
MRIGGLALENFRNVERAELEFSDTFNLFTGDNAQGKTNLVEAIHLFSLGRSFRTRRPSEMIRFGEEFFRLEMTGRSDGGVSFRLGLGLERGGALRATVNGKQLGQLSGMIGLVPSVVFTPDDVSLAAGPPADRRLYLDFTGVQVSPPFLGDLSDFRRTLRHRNALLRDVAAGTGRADAIETWNETFAATGAAVARGRREVARGIEEIARELFAEFLPGGELGVEYRCPWDPGGDGGAAALADALARCSETERRRGVSLAGPQYDDLSVTVDGRDLRRYGSQGRRRLAAIVLKLAQASLIMSRRGERPVVLLDDIFSELDRGTIGRARALLTDRWQSFITTPREEDFPRETGGGSRFVVEAGCIAGAFPADGARTVRGG